LPRGEGPMSEKECEVGRVAQAKLKKAGFREVGSIRAKIKSASVCCLGGSGKKGRKGERVEGCSRANVATVAYFGG